MFPYPSERVFVGHPEGYTAADILNRFKRAQGYNVLHPMGWDAFGLPAEAIHYEHENDPAEFTAENIANFKRQINAQLLIRLGQSTQQIQKLLQMDAMDLH